MTEYKDAEAIKAQIREVCRDCWNIQRVGGCVMHCGINDAIKAVDAVPTVDAVEVRQGRWVHHPEIGWGSTWLCSECGEKTVETVMGEPRYKFCPMCGADMREDGKGWERQ